MPEKFMRYDERDYPLLCFTPPEVDLICTALDRLSFQSEVDALLTNSEDKEELTTRVRLFCLLTQQKLLGGDELRITDPETLFIFRSLRNWCKDLQSIAGTPQGMSEIKGSSPEVQAWLETAGHLIELMSV